MYYDYIKDIIEDIYGKDPGTHDVGHALRTANMSLYLGRLEGAGDPAVLEVAALLHDIHRIRQTEEGRPVDPRETVGEVMDAICELNGRIVCSKEADKPSTISESQATLICNAIVHHEHYAWNGDLGEMPIEVLILQDADNLDAIGAVGTGRSCAYHGAHSSPIYNGEPVDFDKDPNYVENIVINKSGLHHFADVLLHLNESMNTKTGKLIADKRVERMRTFCEWYLKEWNNEDFL